MIEVPADVERAVADAERPVFRGLCMDSWSCDKWLVLEVTRYEG